MVRKTRRHHSNKKSNGAHSIPELRRAFEHIDSYVNEKIAVKESKEKIIKDLRKEWSKVFLKDLDKKSADSFVSDRISKKPASRTIRGTRGGGQTPGPLSGAPLDYTTRPGVYLNADDYVGYVNSGLSYPEPGRLSDPVIGQQRFPTFAQLGGGKRKTRRGTRKGANGFANGAANGGAYSGPQIVQDMKSLWYGTPTGPSPDQALRSPSYKTI